MTGSQLSELPEGTVLKYDDDPEPGEIVQAGNQTHVLWFDEPQRTSMIDCNSKVWEPFIALLTVVE